METLIKKLKIFLIKQIYICNYRWTGKQIPTGILIFTDHRKHAFFYPDEFGQVLHDLTGRHIYKEQIAHYEMIPLADKNRNFTAWCWRDKKFFFFSPVGSNLIFMALTRQFSFHHRRNASVVLDEKFNGKALINRVVLYYKIDKHGFPIPQQTVIEEENRNSLLALYHNEDFADILKDVENLQKHNLDFNSLKRIR